MKKIYKKKIRGLNRKHKVLKAKIKEICSVFPEVSGSYWHMHMPCNDQILDYPKVRHKYRQKIAHFLIEQSENLNKLKPNNQFVKVVCFLPFSGLWSAQIIVFFNQEYYNSFFIRNHESQRWVKKDLDRATMNKWCIFNEAIKFRGYHETIIDEDYYFETDIWFYEC